MKTLVVNLFGGPGAGKSKIAHRLVSELKERCIGVEMAPEYAKDKTWEESMNVLCNQPYVFGKQQHRIWRVDGKVPIIITDSPLLFSLVYGKEDTSEAFKNYVIDEYRKRPTLNIYVRRMYPYDPNGRNQTEEKAIALDREIYNVVETVDHFHMHVDGTTEQSNINDIVDEIIAEYRKLNPEQ